MQLLTSPGEPLLSGFGESGPGELKPSCRVLVLMRLGGLGRVVGVADLEIDRRGVLSETGTSAASWGLDTEALASPPALPSS